MNNIYNKLAELQWQIQHHDPHMDSGDTIQIEVPDFDPDIDDVSPTAIDQQSNNPSTQGSGTPASKAEEQEIECITPASSHRDTDSQEIDWPDAIPVEIPPQRDQQKDYWKYPLEENLDEEQYQDLDTYLTHHNTFEASQRIHQDY